MFVAMLEESMILQLCKSVQERPLGRRIPHLNVALKPKVLSLQLRLRCGANEFVNLVVDPTLSLYASPAGRQTWVVKL